RSSPCRKSSCPCSSCRCSSFTSVGFAHANAGALRCAADFRRHRPDFFAVETKIAQRAVVELAQQVIGLSRLPLPPEALAQPARGGEGGLERRLEEFEEPAAALPDVDRHEACSFQPNPLPSGANIAARRHPELAETPRFLPETPWMPSPTS